MCACTRVKCTHTRAHPFTRQRDVWRKSLRNIRRNRSNFMFNFMCDMRMLRVCVCTTYSLPAKKGEAPRQSDCASTLKNLPPKAAFAHNNTRDATNRFRICSFLFHILCEHKFAYPNQVCVRALECTLESEIVLYFQVIMCERT